MFANKNLLLTRNHYPLVYVALDKTQNENLALAKMLCEQLPDGSYGFKINIDSVLDFSEEALSPRKYLDQLASLKKPIFLDLKLHNGPGPMMKLAAKVKNLVDVIDMHASAGKEFIQKVSEILKGGKAKLFAVTLLTHDKIENVEKSLEVMIKLANDAVSGGADGLIMPPTMLKEMRKRYPTIPIITPGIRPEWFQDKKINHQQEISTPTEAMRDGATALVIGSPICLSNNPVDALTMILDELALNRDLTCHSISANRQINIT